MSDLPLISVDNISKRFCRSLKRSLWYGVKDIGSELAGTRTEQLELRKGEFWAVDDVSFELHAGETLGLIGPNGSGKTTLLRMLNGLIKPDRGRITIRGQMQALIALGAGFSPVLTGRENIYINASVLGIPKAVVDKQFDEIVEFSGIPEFIDAPVRSYSSGMTVRLGFAVAAHMHPDILLVDEVLAVGDEGFKVKCINKIAELKKSGTAIILVSHSMHMILNYSNRVLLKTSDGHKIYDNPSEGVNAYKHLFIENHEDTEIDKMCSGNEEVKFHSLDLESSELSPGSTFNASLCYQSNTTLENIEVDIAIETTHDTGMHFQANNKLFNQTLAIKQGEGKINISIRDLKPHGTSGRISIAVWKRNREELLMWWKIPVMFPSVPGSMGSNFYETEFS